MIAKLFGFLVPNSGGALWIGIVVAIALAADFGRLASRRNAALGLLLLTALFLAPCLRWGPAPTGLLPRATFSAIWLTTGLLTVWAFLLLRRGSIITWTPNLTRQGLRTVIAVLLALDVVVTMGRAPDDAGIYSNLGARRWLDTGVLPYGDAALKGPNAPAFGAAATYGPVLYAAHVPFQIILRAPSNPPELAPRMSGYRWPTAIATKLACLTFFVAGLAALYSIMRRLAGEERALLAVALFAGSPYVLGLGSDSYVLTGLGFISHIAPSALVLLALASYQRPLLSGSWLALAAGALFWPVFLAPAWFGWRLWRREQPWRFVAGYAITAAVLVLVVIYATHAPEGSSTLRMFLESTLEHQEGTQRLEYGASLIGFWGQNPGLANILHRPLFGDTSLFKPTFLAFMALCGASFFLARGRSLAQLAAVTAMLAAGIQLYKTHAAGSYVEWYYPFLLIALLAGRTAVPGDAVPAEAAQSLPAAA